jgi:predicted P-loop ATPase
MKSFSDLACNVGNVLLALKQEPMLMNAFGYDEMLRTEVLLRPLFGKEPNFKRRPVTDADVSAMQSWLQWYGFRGLGKDATHDAVNVHARDHAFHPVRDYLNSLRWDGGGRVRTWLHKYLGAEDNEYTNEIGKMFLIGMVARIFEPGCKFDYMPILEGEQGLYKSKACAILAGPEYFSDQLPDIRSKEASQHLRGKWLIEVPERPLRDASVDQFKEFIVRQVERYRPPWGRREVHEPRQCVFMGTTNKAHYFRDETGNRRFWPTATGEIKLSELRDDRDQLFAEAVNLYHGGQHWWPDREFELAHIVPEQESRYEADVWEPLIKDYLDILHTPKRTTLINIAVNVLDYEIESPLIQPQGQPQEPRKTPINRLGPKEQGRIGAILSHLGWVPKRTSAERWWEPGPKALTR